MVTTKKAAAPGTEAVAKRAVAKPAAAKAVAVAVKPVAAQPAASKPAPAKTVAAKAKAAVRKKVNAPANPAVSAAQRAHYVEVAAFHIAERRGFTAADPTDDWVAAEAEIDRLIASGHFAP